MASVLATVLFTDLVRSTELLSRLGDEEASSVFREYHRVLDQIVHNHGGEVVKWEGDGVMATFSSAADAVRGAVAIQEGAAKTISGEGLHVRVGLSAGEVQGWGTNDYFGTPVVVAKRLCDEAEPGQILCTDVVGGLLAGRRAFRFRPIGPMSLKGLDAPMAILQVEYDRPEPVHIWTEGESEVYRQIAQVAVPSRAEQLAVLLMLVPFSREERFRVVELGSGEGALAYAILDYFPGAQVVALDGSESMRRHAAGRLAHFGSRVRVDAFQLSMDTWLDKLDDADCVVSSLLLHHLSDAGKRRVFGTICERLSDRGAFLVADVVEAQGQEQNALYAEQYDHIAREQSVSLTGSLDVFDTFEQDRWNIFRYGTLPQDEYPSPLVDQLLWLRSAGFDVVDCYWLKAGFAIFGGHKRRAGAVRETKSMADAYSSAQRALGAVEGGRPIR